MLDLEEIETMTEHEVECPNCGTILSCANCPILIDREEIYNKLDLAEIEANQLKRKIFDLREMVMGWTPAVEAFLVNLVDRKDQYTHAHSQRVTELSLLIGGILKLDNKDLSILKKAARLHDLGKLDVDERILRKPGPLTNEEYEKVKEHPKIAAGLLSSMAYLKDVIEVIYAHHERWDGAGYPRGLKGNDIPYLARIVAIADSIDAMSLDRVYRACKSREAILFDLQKNAGKQFDPEIVYAVIEAQIDLR